MPSDNFQAHHRPSKVELTIAERSMVSTTAVQGGPAEGATKNPIRSRGQLIVEALGLWGEMEADWWSQSNINPNRDWKTVADSGNAPGMNMQDLPSFGHSSAQIYPSRPDPQGFAKSP
ncbi:hypothetical protein F5148DRAFT_1281593 [Russula earlei]|uniref:Uncharacterized protein n=1 Tax=Russula earlei TaxID=71964 RepID=A0ACC0UG69_9AGAM|nr:hypothetical protein F5148DRAFT_1281593 [Russula earlei]